MGRKQVSFELERGNGLSRSREGRKGVKTDRKKRGSGEPIQSFTTRRGWIINVVKGKNKNSWVQEKAGRRVVFAIGEKRRGAAIKPIPEEKKKIPECSHLKREGGGGKRASLR